jgi:hypothetical protein
MPEVIFVVAKVADGDASPGKLVHGQVVVHLLLPERNQLPLGHPNRSIYLHLNSIKIMETCKM